MEERKSRASFGGQAGWIDDDVALATWAGLTERSPANLSEPWAPASAPEWGPSIAARMAAATPAEPPSFLATSLGLAVAVLMLGGLPLTKYAKGIETLLPQYPDNAVARQIVGQVWADPILIQMLTGGVALMLLWGILKNLNLHGLVSFSLAALLLIVLVLVVQSFSAFVLKPGLGIPRPSDYDTSLEPPITQWYHNTFGAGEAAPSGTLLRQAAITMLAMWLMMHPRHQRLSRTARIGLRTLFIFAIVWLALQRYYLHAHSAYDLLLGLSSGIVVFWIPTSCFVSVVCVLMSEHFPSLRETARSIMRRVTVGWLLLVLVLTFDALDPGEWIAKGMLVTGILLVVLAIIAVIPSRSKLLQSRPGNLAR